MAEATTGKRLSTAAFVVLTPRGFVIPRVGDHPEVRLDDTDLARLVELAAGATDHASGDLLAHLDRRGWLVDADERDAAAQGAGDGPTSTRRRIPPVDAGTPRDDPSGDDVELVVPTPLVIDVDADGFTLRSPDGADTATIGTAELVALGTFRRPVPRRRAAASLLDLVGGDTGQPIANEHLERWMRLGALDARAPAVPAPGHGSPRDEPDDGLRHSEELLRRLEHRLLSPPDDETRDHRVPVVPVHSPVVYPNLALGLILASAMHHDGGRLTSRYDLGPHWGLRRTRVRRFLELRGPAVLLASDYVWSSEDNLALTARAKELDPRCVVVHGGPNVPRHPADVEAFLVAHPHVDVVTRNEGEHTTAELLDALDARLEGELPVDALREVAGISFRDGDRVVRTDDRDRIRDLDEIPSPYLTGLFDNFAEAPLAILETNRGCPYGCTFCDWGQATLSRIRNFSLERVFAEVEQVGRLRLPTVVIADANFGIHQRDVEIAEHIAAVKDRYGFPKDVRTSFAKNTKKHLEKIIRVLVDAGITTEAVLAQQTSDPVTLQTIRRSNIKTEKYDDLAATFRRERLPMATELMMGLPGATLASFDADLQRCVDHEMPVRVYRTELLVNSPMNDPGYRAENEIGVELADDEPVGSTGRRRPLLVSTASYTEADLREMLRHRELFNVLESYGLARHLARFVRQELGIPEMELYVRLGRDVGAAPGRFPHLAFAIAAVPALNVAPQSWELCADDLHRYVTDELGLAASSALETVLAVQVALAPDRHRRFPARYELPHDYAAWFSAALDAKELDLDWVTRTPRLASYGPGELVVDDPGGLVTARVGRPLDQSFYGQRDLRSAVSRAAGAAPA